MYSSNRANVMVRHEPRPVGKSNYSLVRILRLVLTILFSYSSFPLRAAAAGRLRDLGAELRARRLLPAARGCSADATVPGLDDARGAALGLQRLHHRAALDARRVRRAHPQHGRAPRSRYHVVDRVPGSDPALPGDRRPAVRHDVPPRPAGRATPTIAMARPARPEPKVFLSDELAERGADWYRAHLLRPRRRAATARREEHQLPRVRRGVPTRAAAVLGDAADRGAAARPGRAGRSPTGAFSRDHGLEQRPLAEALRANLDGPLRLGPGGDLGLAVRLPRARPVRRATCARGWTRSRTGARAVPRGAASPTRARSATSTAGSASTRRVRPDVRRRSPCNASRAVADRARRRACVAGCATTSPSSDRALADAARPRPALARTDPTESADERRCPTSAFNRARDRGPRARVRPPSRIESGHTSSGGPFSTPGRGAAPGRRPAPRRCC